VLDLIRERLTNDQIAERLGITLDGAKYHVSQILSKLGVESREDAARWEPKASHPWWRILVPLPMVAKTAGIALTAATVAAIGVLVLGVIQTGTSRDGLQPADLPPPDVPPALNVEQAIIRAAYVSGGNFKDVHAQASTSDAIRGFLEGQPAEAITGLQNLNPAGTAWLVSVRSMTTGAGVLEFRSREPTGDVVLQCRDTLIAFLESDRGQAVSISAPLPENACEGQLDNHLMLLGAAYMRDPAIVDAHSVSWQETTQGEIQELRLSPEGPFADLYFDPATILSIEGTFDDDFPWGASTPVARKCGTLKVVIGSAGTRFLQEKPC
jgi:hypothetical protein